MNKPSEKELKPCRSCESRNVELVRADDVYVQHCNDCSQDAPCNMLVACRPPARFYPCTGGAPAGAD